MKKKEIIIKGYLPAGLYKDVKVYYSQTVLKFVPIEKIFIGDLLPKQKINDNFLEGITQDFPMLDRFLGLAKIKIKIEM